MAEDREDHKLFYKKVVVRELLTFRKLVGKRWQGGRVFRCCRADEVCWDPFDLEVERVTLQRR